MNSRFARVIIYGGGGYCALFQKAMSLSGVEVVLVIDQYTDKRDVCGVPVVRLGDRRIEKSVPIYVSLSGLSDRIVDQLKELGHTEVYGFKKGIQTFPALLDTILPRSSWYATATERRVDVGEVDALRRRLADDRSRTVLQEICAFRDHFDPDHYLENDGQLQYFADDVPLFVGMTELRFIDCGACTGDTLLPMLDYCRSSGLAARAVCLFEPEHENLLALNEVVSEHVPTDCHAVIVPCGTWSTNTIVQFSAARNSSAIIETSTAATEPPSLHSIATVSLDDSVRGMRPNYIKMDIEGAEHEALRGAAEIIRTTEPVLAICVYHKADDLWEIPKLIDSINPEYEFYLRVHGDMGLEVVLYAVPSSTSAHACPTGRLG